MRHFETCVHMTTCFVPQNRMERGAHFRGSRIIRSVLKWRTRWLSRMFLSLYSYCLCHDHLNGDIVLSYFHLCFFFIFFAFWPFSRWDLILGNRYVILSYMGLDLYSFSRSDSCRHIHSSRMQPMHQMCIRTTAWSENRSCYVYTSLHTTTGAGAWLAC